MTTVWTKVSKPVPSTLTVGSPIGLLLALTYATTGGTSWTKVGKPSGNTWTKVVKPT